VIGGGAVAFLLGIAIALWTQSAGDWGIGASWEVALLRRANTRLPAAFDALLILIAWLGTNITLVPISAVVALFALRRSRRDIALHVAVAQTGSILLNQILKYAFERPRPEIFEGRGWYAQSSFPSGHAIASIAMLFTFAVLLYRERGWRWPLAVALVLVLINLYSRLYLAVHWPTDVIAGAAVGVVWLVATIRAFRPPLTNPESRSFSQ